MKKLLIRIAQIVATFSFFLVLAPSAHAATNGRMIDDSVFDNSGSMSASDIQGFLNGFPNGCLKNYTDDMPSSNPVRAYFDYSGTGSAAQIIRRVADNYGINPRVLLTKLEQESSLISGGGGCQLWRQASAIGFKCFDGANPRTTTFRGSTIQTCVATDADMGVARQLSKGGWLLKWGKERANGNLNWMVPDDAVSTYGGPMTQGSKKRCAACATVYYDGYWSGVYLESGATASLYNYTPYLNQAFDEIWESWWGAGSTYAPRYNYVYVSQSTDRNLGTIVSGQASVLNVVVKNAGSTTWLNSGSNPVRLAPSRPLDKSSQFAGSTWIAPHRVSTMQEPSVAPGENATFSFIVQAPYVGSPTNFREDYRLVMEGITWLPDIDLHFDFRVSPSQYIGTVTAGTLPTTLASAGTTTVNLSVRNDGNVSWYQGGRYPVRIGTRLPYDHRSIFDAGTWISATRPDALNEIEVAPGQTGTFSFVMRGPAYAGQYQEGISLVAEGLSWFNSPILSSQISVTGGQATGPSTLRVGQVLPANSRLTSPNGNYRLEMQGDGNLVLYSPTRATWHVGTFNKPTDRLLLQADGNLVLYDAQGKYYWATMTDAGAYLTLQNDGNLVLYRADGYPLWYTIR